MKELKGVNGWLWWFTYIVLGVVGVGFNLVGLVNAPFIAALITLPVVGLAAAALTLLVMENPIGVMIAKVYLFVNLVLGAIAVAVPPSNVAGLKAVIFSAGWLTYLWTSKRVQNTYFTKGSVKGEENV